jgi:alpha-amylase
MPSICFYFQVHQPFRLKRLSSFDSVRTGDYFDEELNRLTMKKVAAKCYLPANHLMLELIRRYKGAFKIAYSISGVAIEQMNLYAPEALETFQQLAATGAVEFLSETYHHSLTSLWSGNEFEEQVQQHRRLTRDLFGYDTKVFRNTELIYSDLLARRIADMGFVGCVAEGADDIMGWRSANYVYESPTAPLKLLLKNYKLSDDIAFRFSNESWSEWPLTPEKFARWVQRISGSGDTLNLFMDYETFGEHQWEEHGIFRFLEKLPEDIFALGDWDFATPSEVIVRYKPYGPVPFPRTGNEMQIKALSRLQELETMVKGSNNPETIKTWRRLTTSDHFYYMCTKWLADGDVHAYFNPYDSPYDAFVYFQNALRDFTTSLHIPPVKLAPPEEKLSDEKAKRTVVP